MKTNRRFIPLFILSAIASMAFTNTTRASTLSIGINFGADQYSLLSTDLTGVVSQGNWNNESGPNGTAQPLSDAAGILTSATVTFSSPGTWYSGGLTGTADGKLLYGYLDGSNVVPATVSITNVPYGSYDAYIYINRDNTNSTSTYTVNGNTTTITPGFQLTTFSVAGATIADTPNSSTAGSYIKFSGLTGDFSLSTSNTGGGSDFRSPVNGVQLVAIPEPSTYALALGSFAMLIGLRNFRSRRTRV